MAVMTVYLVEQEIRMKEELQTSVIRAPDVVREHPASCTAHRLVHCDELATTLRDIFATRCQDLKTRPQIGEPITWPPSVIRAYEVVEKLHEAP